ncbi:MAG TPA: DUF4178 domain-containing protein [Gemmatimonas sp.]
MTTPAPRVPKAAALNCSSCGAAIELHAMGWAVSVVCAACGATMDATDANLRILQHGDGVRLKPSIPLGTRGTWKGTAWEVIGSQQVTITVEEVDYSWVEYVCFNPWRGFLYLSEYQGHWNVIEKLRRAPERERGGVRPTVDLGGVTYMHFQTARARTTAALGEFPWELRVGDEVIARDFVSPPYLLSAEGYEEEVTWSQGTYTPPDVIAKAFNLGKDALIKPIGVFANQPNPYGDLPKKIFKLFGLSVVALFVMFLANVVLSGNRTVFQQGYAFTRGTEDQAAFVTPVFELDGRPSAVSIDIESPLDNDWLYLTLALIEENTGETREASRQVSYYSGTDSDGKWTEGSRSGTVRLATVPAGRYFLRVQPEGGEPAKRVANYTIKVRRDSPFYGLYFVAFFALLIPAIFAVVPSASFERRRWAESDHAPVSSDDDDSGGDDE